MALLRVLCLTSSTTTTHISTQNHSPSFSSLEIHHKKNNNKPYSQSSSHNHSTKLTFCHIPFSFRLPCLSITHSTRANTLTFASSTTQQQQTEEATTEEFSTTRLVAQNVPWTSTPEDVRSLFERYGTVLEVELSMYNKTRSRGLAFVEMSSPEEALEALNKLESYEFEGRVLKLNYARPKKKKAPPPVVQRKPVTFNLFVANLSYEATSKDLREFFDSGSSQVVSAEVVFHEDPRKSTGYGFVSFKSKKEANAALSEFQEKTFMGRSLRVAPSKRFVQPLEESSAKPEDTSTELSVNGAGVDNAD
ncbi:28 kDa ribonucleoprotein, chloroplastic [Lotus japonicus]|uniref:28 kDa ribonucleoprotein, chloroplastic n=1 Tax=Lotus japonicus TaxID=34305 RepID=UPI00258DF7A1|nr:28 kDa ribonucleoprotein, chloroplastic [Lotus japonicus]